MTNDQLQVAIALFIVTLILHVTIAIVYSRRYIPLVGRLAQVFDTVAFTDDGDPLYHFYPYADSMSADALRVALSNELTDLRTLADNTTDVFLHVTDDTYGKPFTRSDVINAYHDDAVTAAVADAIDDAFYEDKE